MAVHCPSDIEHPVVVTVPDLIFSEPMLPAVDLPGERPYQLIQTSGNDSPEALASSFCGVHLIGTTTTSASTETINRSFQYVTYSLSLLPEYKNRILTMHPLRMRSEKYALPVGGWPWSYRERLDDPNYHTLPYHREKLKDTFYNHIRHLSVSLSWNSKYGSSSTGNALKATNFAFIQFLLFIIFGCFLGLKRRINPRLQCIDLQYDQKNWTDVLKSDSYPSAVLSGYSNGTVQLAEYNQSQTNSEGYSRYPRALKTWLAASTAIRSVNFHPFRGPHQVVVAADESFLGLFDTRFIKSQSNVIDIVKPVLTFAEHRSTTGRHNVTFDTDADLLVCAGVDGIIRFWSASTGKLINLFEPFPGVDAEERASVQCAYTSLFYWGKETHSGEALLALSKRTIQLYGLDDVFR